MHPHFLFLIQKKVLQGFRLNISLKKINPEAIANLSSKIIKNYVGKWRDNYVENLKALSPKGLSSRVVI